MDDFTRRQISTIVAIAVIVGCIPALQPLLLGGLLEEGRLTAAQMGEAASLESLGMAISVTLAGALFPVSRLRPILAAAAIGAIGANAATYLGAPAIILAARFLAGFCSGVVLWLLVGMLARAANSTRLFAIYVTLSAAGSFALATLLSASGASSSVGYATIAALDGVILLLTPLVPRAYAVLPGSSRIVAPSGTGLIGLLVSALNLAGVMAVWVYLIPLAHQLGYDDRHARAAVSAAIGAQVLAGIAATVLGSRLPGWAAILGGVAASLVAQLLLGIGVHDVALYLSSAIISFFWMFTPPFHLPLILALDRSRRSAMFIGSAQLGGMFAGSALAAALVKSGDYANALYGGIALNLACCVVLVILKLSGLLGRPQEA
jgi:MFS transporter, DHA1 family, inner membrane transport protein